MPKIDSGVYAGDCKDRLKGRRRIRRTHSAWKSESLFISLVTIIRLEEISKCVLMLCFIIAVNDITANY